MTTLPSNIKVGPHVYTVTGDETTVRAEEHALNDKLRGWTDHQKLLIGVDPKLALGMQRQTLWHEVKHAVADLPSSDNVKRTEEEWISRTAQMEVAVLRDNPELVAFLTSED